MSLKLGDRDLGKGFVFSVARHFIRKTCSLTLRRHGKIVGIDGRLSIELWGSDVQWLQQRVRKAIKNLPDDDDAIEMYLKLNDNSLTLERKIK